MLKHDTHDHLHSCIRAGIVLHASPDCSYSLWVHVIATSSQSLHMYSIVSCSNPTATQVLHLTVPSSQPRSPWQSFLNPCIQSSLLSCAVAITLHAAVQYPCSHTFSVASWLARPRGQDSLVLLCRCSETGSHGSHTIHLYWEGEMVDSDPIPACTSHTPHTAPQVTNQNSHKTPAATALSSRILFIGLAAGPN